MKKNTLYFILGILPMVTYSQNVKETILNEMVISHEKLQTHHNAFRKKVLNDTIVKESTQSFTDLLLFNSLIYFKENGSGMVSSPSFRGTTAQQTAVLWNGIRINSVLLGQTDFNAISYKEYNNIVIQPGGSSVITGSGAIGGTIHLNNGFIFKEKKQGSLQLSYGSFDTYRINTQFETGNEKFQFLTNIHHNQSENDFDVPYRNWKNTNGQYYNSSFNTSIGYRFYKGNELSFHSNTYQDERHFSLTSIHEIPTKYQNFTNRNLLQWKREYQNINSLLKIAYLHERYRYFEDIEKNASSSGNVHSYIAKYELDYRFNTRNKISSVMEYQIHNGTGENTGIVNAQQKIGSIALLFTHLLSSKSGIEIGIRKEMSKDFESPYLYSAEGYFQLNKNYKLTSALSKNFRIPTFNDIYWQPGGNLHLKPETSTQIEVGQIWNNSIFSVHHQVYYNKITNMIRWLPTNLGYWSAFNTDSVEILGTELEFNSKFNWNKHYLYVSFGYTFNQSIDLSTSNLLTYSPKHRFITTFNYQYDRWNLRLQSFYNGKVYTKSDNDEDTAITGYALANAFLSYEFGKNKQYKVAFEIRNFLHNKYENVENRPMPGRNFNIQLITHF